jgi:hypothetical protein
VPAAKKTKKQQKEEAVLVSSSDDGVDEKHGADIGSDADDSEEEVR